MISHKPFVIAAGLALVAPAAAFADTAAADACAQGLSPESQAIYQATLPAAATAPDLRAAIKSSTLGLVKAGEIKRSEARSAATAAGSCLRLARE